MKEIKFNREWVKTAAIIFLAVLLVLTFFSNTIMNMTLPEVSTDYVQYGTIKTQVRGSGTVLAQDSYSVTTSSTREVLKVAVREGDEVKKGDVLLTLSETESAELTAARDKYDNLNYEYTKMLLESGANSVVEEKQYELEEAKKELDEAKKELEALLTAQTAIEAAEDEVKATQRLITKKEREIAELEAQKGAVGYTPTEEEVILGRDVDVDLEDYTQASKQLDEADKKIDEAQKALTLAKEENNTAKAKYDKVKREYDDISEKIQTPLKTLKEQIKSAEREIEALERDIKYVKQDAYANRHNEELEDAHEEFKEAQAAYRSSAADYEAALNDPDATPQEISKAYAILMAMEDKMEAAFLVYDELLTKKEEVVSSIEKELAQMETSLKYKLEDTTELVTQLKETEELDALLEEKKVLLDQSELVYFDASSRLEEAQAVFDNANEQKELLDKELSKTRNSYKYVVFKEYETKIDNANAELEVLKEQLEEQNETVTDLKDENPQTESALKEQIKSLEKQIITIQKEIEKALKDAGNAEKLNNLELQRKKDDIQKAKEEVEKLEKEFTEGKIVSPVNGVVEAVHVVSGGKTQPDQPLLDISLSENGFKMTMTATQEQASKLRPGMQAEITSYIPYGSEIKATLVSIKNDTSNPGSRQKVLEFSIDGDVTPNEQLSVAVGDKNASYDYTVPNTAVREDSSGKYILVVDSKSTPISTRYVARRVNVSVVASDDIRSAISGELDHYSYVVATSSKPINDKDQVKLVEN